MSSPRKKSWKRDCLRMAMLTAVLVGVPTGAWGIALYRKHVQAVYYACLWAPGKDCPFNLRKRLVDMKAPSQAKALAWRTVHRLATCEEKKTAAAYNYAQNTDTRHLYELAKRAGHGSPTEQVLLEELHSCAWFAMSEPERYGFTRVYADERPPADGKEGAKEHVRFEFGSYRVSCRMDWFKVPGANGKMEWRAHHSPLWCSLKVERLPGLWRELPPPPPETEEDESDSHYKRL